MPRRKTRMIFWVLGGLLVLPVLGMQILNHVIWRDSVGSVAEALRQATGAEAIEFLRDRSSGVDENGAYPEYIFQRRTLTPEQLAALLATTQAPWYFAEGLPWEARCFSPHHGVELKLQDGTAVRLEGCFLCNNFRLGRSGIHSLQAEWRLRLWEFYTGLGMAPREAEHYLRPAAPVEAGPSAPVP